MPHDRKDALLLEATRGKVHYKRNSWIPHKTLDSSDATNKKSDPNDEFDQHENSGRWKIWVKGGGFELHDNYHVENNQSQAPKGRKKSRRLWVETDTAGKFTRIMCCSLPKQRSEGKAANPGVSQNPKKNGRQKQLGKRIVKLVKYKEAGQDKIKLIYLIQKNKTESTEVEIFPTEP